MTDSQLIANRVMKTDPELARWHHQVCQPDFCPQSPRGGKTDLHVCTVVHAYNTINSTILKDLKLFL